MRLTVMGYAALLCLTAAANAQQNSVIRTETRVVLVDTIVTDKQGGYVHDLAAKDFRVWEDNKEQTIKGVALEKGSAAATSRPRYLVLFFAPMEAVDGIAARQAVSGFVDANADENRKIAVVSYNGGLRIAQNFTDDAGRLKEAVNQAIASGVVTGGAADSATFDTIRALGVLAGSLGVLEGRKTIVFVGGGLSQSSARRAELTTTIDACNKSDVAVYPIDVRPLSANLQSGRPSGPFEVNQSSNTLYSALHANRRGGGGPQGDEADADAKVQDAGTANQQLLFRLAGGTGGFVIPNAGDLQAGLQKVGEEQSEYYVLSYTPPDPKEGSKEGNCHTLRVKVDRGGTTVRARANYCDSKPQDLLAGTAAGQDLERRAAAAQAGGIAASMQLSYFYLSPGVARVNLAMEIPPGALKFRNQKSKPGKPQAELNFLGIAAAPDGGVGARFSDTVKLDPESQAKPVHYEREFKIVPGQYSFTMVFSSGGENFGKLEAPLTVDPRQAGELAMSGLVLSKETHPAAEVGLDLASLVESRTPLVTEGIQVVPSGSSLFSKSEPGYFYFEVYSADPASVRVGVRVLDRRTGEPKWDPGLQKLRLPKNAGETMPGGSVLPIEALAAGSYEFEVTAVDSTGMPIRRKADFDVR